MLSAASAALSVSAASLEPSVVAVLDEPQADRDAAMLSASTDAIIVLSVFFITFFSLLFLQNVS